MYLDTICETNLHICCKFDQHSKALPPGTVHVCERVCVNANSFLCAADVHYARPDWYSCVHTHTHACVLVLCIRSISRHAWTEYRYTHTRLAGCVGECSCACMHVFCTNGALRQLQILCVNLAKLVNTMHAYTIPVRSAVEHRLMWFGALHTSANQRLELISSGTSATFINTMIPAQMHIPTSRGDQRSLVHHRKNNARMCIGCGEHTHQLELEGTNMVMMSWWKNADGQQMKIDFAGTHTYNHLNCMHTCCIHCHACCADARA